jgi:hypothetical protein
MMMMTPKRMLARERERDEEGTIRERERYDVRERKREG